MEQFQVRELKNPLVGFTTIASYDTKEEAEEKLKMCRLGTSIVSGYYHIRRTIVGEDKNQYRWVPTSKGWEFKKK